MFAVDYFSTEFMETQSDKMMDRKYAKLYQIAESFLNQRKNSKPQYIRLNPFVDSFVCVKSKKCFNLANDLLRAGYDVSVKPVCADRIYEILLDFATIFTFWQVPVEIFETIIKTGQSTEIPSLSLKNQLIIIYRDLYDPTHFSDLETNLALKDIVIKNSKNRIDQKIKNFQQNKIKIDRNQKVIHFAEEVVIGRQAIELIARSYKQDLPKNFFASNTIEIISEDVQKTIDNLAANHNITYETQDFPIFSDIALQRTKIIVEDDIEIIVYNSASYELIPFFIIENKRVASIFVIARFVLINIFFLKFLVAREKIEESAAKDQISSLEIQHYFITKIDDYQIPEPQKITVSDLEKHYYGQFVEPRILYFERCPQDKIYNPFEARASGRKLIYF